MIITPPTGKSVTFLDFTSSSKNLKLSLKPDSMKLPWTVQRTESLKFNFEILPQKIGATEMFVVYFRGRIGSQYLVHPMRLLIKTVDKSKLILTYKPKGLKNSGKEKKDGQPENLDQIDYVVWIKNTVYEHMKITEIDSSTKFVKRHHPWDQSVREVMLLRLIFLRGKIFQMIKKQISTNTARKTSGV